MSAADLVAIATIASMLDVLQDFTGDREKVSSALAALAYTEGTAVPPAAATASMRIATLT